MIVWGSVDPSLLEPEFHNDLVALLTPSQWTWYMLYGYRSLALQNELYDKYIRGGPKAAPPGKSAHNFGLAVDLVPDLDPEKPGLQPNWITTSSAWLWLYAKVKLHPRLKSGIVFGDGDHVEKVRWQNYKEWNTLVGQP